MSAHCDGMKGRGISRVSQDKTIVQASSRHMFRNLVQHRYYTNLLLVIFVFSFLQAVPSNPAMASKYDAASDRRLPPDFWWGTATAAYQIEGATAEGHRSPSIWDRFCKEPGKIRNNDTGDVACDHYHRYREDVQLIKALGTKYYRFSIAWPRILPEGTRGSPNKDGIIFYSSLIDELLNNGITPIATLYHWDLPVSVDNATGGWAGDGSVADEFAAYARICFDNFGGRIGWWITLNEPWCSSYLGYGTGEHAPGKKDAPGVDPYRAAHNLLRAHAKAVRIYRSEFQPLQNGRIGITLNSDWGEPADASENAKAAAKRYMEFNLGWFADPVQKGDYPLVMRETVGERLPKFTEEEKRDLKRSSDFFGLNHYSTHRIHGMAQPPASDATPSFWTDLGVNMDSDPSWHKTDMGWAVVPWGLRKLLTYVDREYMPPGGIIITENGLAAHEPTIAAALGDESRIAFYRGYIDEMRKAIVMDNADVRGYFLWSLMDNFEWAYGYEKRFGLYFVDYKTQVRTPKPAVAWYHKLIETSEIPRQ